MAAALEIGTCFYSYVDLMESLDHYCEKTKTKFWKRDARTIGACRSGGIVPPLNPDIVYFEVKFTCVYGGIRFISKNKVQQHKRESLKKSGCPVYFRFKASEDGQALQLVAMNVNHNHELKLPEKKAKPVHKKKQTQKRKKYNVAAEAPKGVPQTEDEFLEMEHVKPEDESTDVSVNDVACEEVPFTFRGFIAPAFTPFKNDLTKSLNLEVIPSYAQFLADLGVSGVLVNGTSGEGMSMNVKERKLAAEAWMDACSNTNQHVMVQVGGAPLPDVLEMAKHAEERGADSLLCLPELYFKPTNCEELARYLKLVGEAAPNTPLLYYHIPNFTNVNINMGQFLNEIGDKVPTFSGIKFTSNNLDEGTAAVKAKSGKYAVFLGADTIMLGAYALGFDSTIATTLNLFPGLAQTILESVQKGKLKEANSAQHNLTSVVQIVTKNGAWVPTMKHAMNLLTPIDVGPPRDPFLPLTSKQSREMETELKSLNL